MPFVSFFFFQAEDGIRDYKVTGVQTCALPIWGLMTLGFKTRLWLGHVAVLAVMLAAAAFGAEWALRSVVLGRIIDDAILSLASTEAAALQADPGHPIPGPEIPPGGRPPPFVPPRQVLP